MVPHVHFSGIVKEIATSGSAVGRQPVSINAGIADPHSIAKAHLFNRPGFAFVVLPHICL